MSTDVDQFENIGNTVNGLFDQEFPVGCISFQGTGAEKTVNNTGSRLSIKGTHNIEDGKMSGEISNEMSYLAVTCGRGYWPVKLEGETKIGSDGTLVQRFTTKDLLRGLGISVIGSLPTIPSEDKSKRRLQFDAQYFGRFGRMAFGTNSSIPVYNPVLKQCGVMWFENVFVGGKIEFDVFQRKPEDYGVGMGYVSKWYRAHIYTTDKLNGIVGGVYQKFEKSGIETGCRVTWNRKESNPFNMEVAGKFPASPGSFLKCKVNDSGILGLSYCTLLGNKLSMIMSTSIDGRHEIKSDSKPNHKLGLGFVVDI